ncbi:MAG: HD domain-containing protein [Calditrichaeota bacterium]|nr:MAG: HD domain-containing protein [Calditrichota bacterium]
MTENQIDNELKSILALYKRALPLKELPRIGWIMEGCTRSESDSIAAHSYSVALVSYLTAKRLDEKREKGELILNKPIRWDHVLAMAVLHDLAESVTGDMATGFKQYVSSRPEYATLIEDLEHGFLKKLVGDDLTKIVEEYDSMSTPEARIVKFADVLDAFGFAEERMKRRFETYLDNSRNKLAKPCPINNNAKAEDAEKVGELLAEWLEQAIEYWHDIPPLLSKGGYVLGDS